MDRQGNKIQMTRPLIAQITLLNPATPLNSVDSPEFRRSVLTPNLFFLIVWRAPNLYYCSFVSALIHLSSVDMFGKQGARSRDIALEEVGISTSVSVFALSLKFQEIKTEVVIVWQRGVQ